MKQIIIVSIFFASLQTASIFCAAVIPQKQTSELASICPTKFSWFTLYQALRPGVERQHFIDGMADDLSIEKYPEKRVAYVRQPHGE